MMRLTFFFNGYIDDADPPAEILAKEDGLSLGDDSLSDYLERHLAEAGVEGGNVQLWVEEANFGVKVIFWIPENFGKEEIAMLEDFSRAQMDDGIGEGGFDLSVDGRLLVVVARTDESVGRELVDDGRVVSKPSPIIALARDGKLSLLREAILAGKPINTSLQGYTGLHFAILNGHVDCARLLIEAGADPNSVDTLGSSPLQLVALSNSIEDDESLLLTQILLHVGANPGQVQPGGDSAKDYAIARGKVKTAAAYR